MGRPKQSREETAWILDSSKGAYDPSRFYLKTSDVRGHSAMVTIRILPEAMSAMTQIFQSKEFPYRTVQDIIRDAIIHRIASLRELSEHPEKISSLLLQLMAIDDIISHEEELLLMEGHIARLETVVSKMATSIEGRDEAKKAVMGVVDKMELMPDGYIKRDCMRRIQEKFSWLME